MQYALIPYLPAVAFAYKAVGVYFQKAAVDLMLYNEFH